MFVYEVLQTLAEMVKPGVTTAELNERALELSRKQNTQPAFLGYPSHSGKGAPFPCAICASVNEVIVHGIANDTPLKEGDILSVDYGCVYEGFYGDSAVTIAVGKVSDAARRLMNVTKQSLEDAIAACAAHGRVGDISSAVQTRVEANGFAVVREFVGHGIGRKMHEPPPIPNYGTRGQGRVLKPGLVIAIEPMVTAGSYETMVLDDGWTAVTKDGSLAAHFEHTVAITDRGPYVLSRP
jgi:methionyl aminopeptidase